MINFRHLVAIALLAGGAGIAAPPICGGACQLCLLRRERGMRRGEPSTDQLVRS